MTTRKKPATGKVKTLRLKKETIKDLGTAKKRGDVKGGAFATAFGGCVVKSFVGADCTVGGGLATPAARTVLCVTGAC